MISLIHRDSHLIDLDCPNLYSLPRLKTAHNCNYRYVRSERPAAAHCGHARHYPPLPAAATTRLAAAHRGHTRQYPPLPAAAATRL